MKLSPHMVFVLVSLLLGCSVNIEDPIQDTQTKINEAIPATTALLIGRWVGKSAIYEQSTSQINLSNVTLDFLHDGTYLLSDAEQLVFSETDKGRISLSNNTLTLFNQLEQPAMKFRIALSFQGNYLKLIDEDTKKESLFVRQTLPKKEDWPEILLAKGEHIWEYRGWRQKTDDEIRPSKFQGNFFYIRFEKSSLLVEANRNGLVDSTFPSWELHSDTLYLIKGKVEKYIMDFHDTDSLVLWPLGGISLLRITGLNPGSLDFFIFKLTSKRHSNYRNLNYLARYWRGDTINGTERHYGNYYDLQFSETGSVTVRSASPSSPDFSAWQLLDGQVQLQLKGSTQFSPYHPRKLAGSAGTTRLSVNGPLIRGVLTAVDSAGFNIDPLKRFSDRSYVKLTVNTKPYEFFFHQKYGKDSAGFDKVEMSHVSQSAQGKVALTVKHGEFHSSESGFRFAMEFIANNANPLFFFCDTTATSSHMRTTGVKVKNMMEGKIVNAEVVDGNGNQYKIEGLFRYTTDNPSPLTKEFWKKIPVKE